MARLQLSSMQGESLARQPAFTTLAEMLSRRASSREGFRFVADDESEQTLSFGELHRRARGLTAQLKSQVGPGERVLLLHPPGLEFLVGLFACLFARLVAVPLYAPRHHRRDQRLASVAISSGARLALVSSTWNHDSQGFAEVHPELARLEMMPTSTVSTGRDEGWLDPNIGMDDIALLQYTSGSTGDPRGVVLTHRCVLHNLDCMTQRLGFAPGLVGVSWLPAFHDMGLIGNILQALYSDGTLILFSPASFAQHPIRWLRLITRFGAFVSGGPNFAFDLCCQRIAEADVASLDLSSWRVAYCGAEPVSHATLRRFTEKFAHARFQWRSLTPCYGLAESSLMVTAKCFGTEPVIRTFAADSIASGQAESVASSTPAGRVREIVSCGRPIDGHEIRIVDPQTRVSLPNGQIGEIWVRGPSVASAYFNCPEPSAEVFHAHVADDAKDNHPLTTSTQLGYLRTGDLGFLADGELFVVGRLKDLLIIRGRNIHPADVEQAAIAACTATSGGPTAAFAVNGCDEQRIGVAVECRRDPGVEAAEIAAAAIRDSIAAEFDVACRAVVFVKPGGFPRTSSGKIQRGECSRLFDEGRLSTWRMITSPPPPDRLDGDGELDCARPHTDAQIADWLRGRVARQRAVPIDKIGLDEPFSAWGLGSAELLAIASELERRLEQRISPTVFYEAATIRKLARRLADGSAPQPSGSRAAPQREGAAVIGMACRFPGAHDLSAYWNLLAEGRSAVRDWPAHRPLDWPAGPPIPRGGYLDDVDHFDPILFGIAPSEAPFLDPQHRLLLEVVWEAFEDAGIAPAQWAGRRVGVFVGICNNDYGRMLTGYTGQGSEYLTMGNAASMAAGRVAYLFDFVGPTLSVDTACSSSLVAVHLALRSLQAGDCELAIVAGVNLILSADVTLSLAEAQFLSPTGRCHTFDQSADGYVRGEGCGVVLLKPISRAISDGDRIKAVALGSAVNQDGASNGITAPNGASQAALIHAALADAKREHDRVSYVEAHGTGTNLGDPIEFGALVSALGQSTSRCAIGGVKANLGHLESAAGMAGLIKTVLQLQHRQIVSNSCLETLNALIPAESSRFYFPVELRDWTTAGGPRLAGISSFGFSGTNAHVIVEEAPATAETRVEPHDCHVLTISARGQAALAALVEAYLQTLASMEPADFGELARASNVCRSRMERRLAVVASDSVEAIRLLRQRLTGNGPIEPSYAVAIEGKSSRRQRLETLATAYEQGAAIDWQEVHGNAARPTIALPVYPYQRERYWLPEPRRNAVRPAASMKPVEAGPRIFEACWLPRSDWSLPPASTATVEDWTAATILRGAQTRTAALQAGSGFEELDALRRDFDRVAGLMAIDTLVRLGASWQVGKRLRPSSLASELNAVTPYQRLVDRLLAIAIEDGRLTPLGDEVEIPCEFDAQELREQRKQLVRRHSAQRIEIELALRCGDHRPDVIRGTRDPLEVLFPDGDARELEHLYASSPISQFYNRLIGDVLIEFLVRRPGGRPLRILEIGAGTGGTTSHLLPLLGEQEAEYVFTDVSPIFLHRAARRFREHRCLRTAQLDIELDARLQGFAYGAFDVVVAANVLHATRNLRTSLSHTRRLLAPGGALVLLEASRPSRLLDMIFGLTSGWWRYEDIELRPGYPLLEPSQWMELLASVGFTETGSLSGHDGDQGMIVARRNDDPVESSSIVQMPDRASRSLLIFADRKGIADAITTSLATQGYLTTTVRPGRCYRQLGEEFEIDLDSADDYRRLLAHCADAEGRLIPYIIFLWAMDAPDSAVSAALAQFQQLLQAATSQDQHTAARTWLVLPARSQPGVAPMSQSCAPLIVTSKEQLPAKIIWCDGAIESSSRAILSEWNGSSQDRWVAYRGDQRYAARLVRQVVVGDSASHEWRDRPWLVLGGNDRRRERAARWLASIGASRITTVKNADTPAAVTIGLDHTQHAAFPWHERHEWRRLGRNLGSHVARTLWIEDGTMTLSERAALIEHIGELSDGLKACYLVYFDEDSPAIQPTAGDLDNALIELTTSASKTEQDESLNARHLHELAPEARRLRLQSYIQDELSKILGCSAAEIDARRPIASYGLDSLMAMQLKYRVTANLGVSLPLPALLQGSSLADIIDRVSDEFAVGGDHADQSAERDAPVPFDAPPPKSVPSDAEIDQLGEAEIDRLLHDLLTTSTNRSHGGQ